MDYILKAKLKSQSVYSKLDLFPDTLINFDLDFYDVNNIDKIKVPVNVSLSLPMTDDNTALINYDPTSSVYTTIPTEPLDFTLSLNGSIILQGNMYVETYSFNNSVPVVEVRLVDRLQEIFSDSKTLKLDDLYQDYNVLTSFDQFLGSNNEVIGTSPTMNDIMFPYLDMCNDTEKFGYAARQFLQFGFDSDRVGFIPAFKVKSFVERFFNEANVSVNSRFFELGNYGTGVTGNNPDDLYMVLPTKLQAASRTRTRGFYLVEGPYEFFGNTYTKDIDASVSNTREASGYPYPSYGWNYNGTTFSNAVDTGYGLDFKATYPNDGTDVDKVFFGSHMGYNAVPSAASRSLVTGSWVGIEIPMVQLGQTSFAMVSQINAATSDAKINIVAKLWEDGFPYETFKMCNTDGSVKDINVSDATVQEMITSKLTFEVNNGSWGNIWSGTTLNNTLEFDDQAIGNFIWEQKEVEIKAGSIYALTIETEIVSGTIDLDYVDTWGPDPDLSGDYDIINETNGNFKSNDLAKVTWREDTNNVGQLYLALSSTESFNPYFDDDDINVIWGLQNADILPFDVVKEILLRFNLSVVYDQNTGSILIDRLNDIRSQNTDTNITGFVDDAQGISVDVVTKVAKSLEISTSTNNLFFDKYGYDKIDLNPAGSEDVKFSLSSRFYNKSLCGDEAFIEVPDGLSEYEVGFTYNQFTKYTDIGITFGYLDTAQYTSNIRRGRFVSLSNNYKGILYDNVGSHTFPRFVTDKPNSLPLYYFDEQGNTTDLYDFFVGNDNVQFFGKPKVKFKALLDTQYGFDIKNNYSVVQLDLIHSTNGIVIKSVSGDLYGGGIYADVEAIIL